METVLEKYLPATFLEKIEKINDIEELEFTHIQWEKEEDNYLFIGYITINGEEYDAFEDSKMREATVEAQQEADIELFYEKIKPALKEKLGV